MNSSSDNNLPINRLQPLNKFSLIFGRNKYAVVLIIKYLHPVGRECWRAPHIPCWHYLSNTAYINRFVDNKSVPHSQFITCNGIISIKIRVDQYQNQNAHNQNRGPGPCYYHSDKHPANSAQRKNNRRANLRFINVFHNWLKVSYLRESWVRLSGHDIFV